MENIYYTKETAPHRPALSTMTTRDQDRFNWTHWENEHRRVQALSTEDLAEHMKHRTTYYWPPCAACDWDAVQKNPDAAMARVEIRRRVRTFQITGKFPSGWLHSNGIKFGGVMLSDEACRKVMITGSPMRYYSEKELKSGKAYTPLPGLTDVLEQTVGKYLQVMGCIRKGKTYGKPAYSSASAPEYILWSCGCETTEDWEKSVVICPKHKRALEGRDDD